MSKQIGLYLDPIINTGGVTFLMKRGTIDFIEQAYIEQFTSIMNKMILDVYPFITGGVYILFGCVDNVFGGNHNVSSGAVYTNGEIFQVPSQVIPVSGSLPLVANINPISWQPIDAVGNNYADPQEFNGAGNSNVHISRVCQFVTGASGTGTLNGGASNSNDIVNFLPLKQSVNWTNISTFGTAWATASTPHCQYSINSSGHVYLRGLAVATSSSATTTILTLPVGFRPNQLTNIPCASYNNSTTTYSVVWISINTSGVVSYTNSSDLPNNTDSNISLDSINFFIS